jgi:hypothetical protein
VVVAGDVFDAAPFSSRRAFLEGVDRLGDIPLFAVAGNHDHGSLPRVAQAEPRVRLLGSQGRWSSAEVVSGLEAVGWSFPSEHVTQSSLPLLPPRSSPRRIGILHGEAASTSRYHPISESDLAAPGAEAWILGHIHGYRLLAGGKAAYPGSPQALDPGEQGRHGVLWLEDGQNGWAFSDLVPLSTIFYGSLDLSVQQGGEEGIYEIEAQLRIKGEEERRASSWLQSCQWRVRVSSEEGTIDLSQSSFPLDSRDHFQIIQATQALRLDLAVLSARNDLPGAMARMLVAWETPHLAEDQWRKDADLLLEKAESLANDIHRAGWAGIDAGEGVPEPPGSEDLQRTALSLLTRITREQLGRMIREELK